MGYSKSPATIRKREKDLRPLLSGPKPVVWQITEGSADDFAYRIREALWIADNVASARVQYPGLAAAHAGCKIVVHGSQVHALVISRPAAQVLSSTPTYQQATIPGPTQVPETRVLPMAASVGDIIQFWIDSQPTNADLQVTGLVLSNSEMDELEAWARKLSPAWSVVHTRGESHLVLRPSVGRRMTPFKPAPLPPGGIVNG